MSDAAHLLTDLATFLVSLFAIKSATKHPTKKMPYGFGRYGKYKISIMDMQLLGILGNKSFLRENRNFMHYFLLYIKPV